MSKRGFGHTIGAFAALISLLPLSLWAEEVLGPVVVEATAPSPACQDWVSDVTVEELHPFFSIARAEDVTRCLNAGSSPYSRTDEGWTPLHLAAAFNDSAAVIVVLLEAGADPFARDEYGFTPLHFAAINSNLGVTLTILDSGADVNARDEERFTPLHYAAAHNRNVEIINALVDAGSDPNARTEYGETPLHGAAMFSENPAVFVALLDGGADPISRDDSDDVPWDYATENELLKGTAAYWCLNDARWRAMDSDDQRAEPLSSWCRSLLTEENAPH